MIYASADQSSFDNIYKALGTLGALGTFLWTVYTWRQKSSQEIAARSEDAAHATQARILEATKPFLDRQLQLYTEITRAASVIATSDDPREVGSAAQRFLQLFAGELALVENEEVSAAMQNYRRELVRLQTISIPTLMNNVTVNLPDIAQWQRENLVQLSFDLAQACRKSLAKSWNVEAWAHPDNAAKNES